MLCYAKSLQSCPTLCDPIDGSPTGFPVPGILQARTLELVAISFSSAWKWKVKVKSFSRVRLLATPWTAAYQAPLSMGFSRQEYWSGVPLPSPHHSMTIGLFTAVPFTQYIMADYQEKKKMTRHSKYTVGKDTASIRTRQGRDGGMIRPGIGNNYD